MEGDNETAHRHRRIQHFNPLPPHGGRPVVRIFQLRLWNISIHSLRMEGDNQKYNCCTKSIYFNPLPPHGGRLRTIPRLPTSFTFQSTPSAWRETFSRTHRHFPMLYFNPLPPHGGRPVWKNQQLFNSQISIHSLRMEGDYPYCCTGALVYNFNPLPPHGGRQQYSVHLCKYQTFQSTPSAWRETFTLLSIQC